MNCYDCAATGAYRPAVAICVDCGAGVCIEHAVNTSHWLTRTQAVMRVERVDPPARIVRCETCHAARSASGDITPATRIRTGRATMVAERPRGGGS